MSETKEKKERLVTPVGEAKWAHVHQPKPAYDERGQPRYQIDVVFSDADADWKSWATAVMDRLRAMPTQTDRTGKTLEKQSPIKPEIGQDDKPTGRFFCTFKTGEKYKPAVFDRFGVPVPDTVLVGNGSKVRVNYSPSEYKGFGGGIALYLNAVQVLELVEYKPQSADGYGFTCEKAPASADFPDAPPTTPCDEAGVPLGANDDHKLPF